MATENVWQSSRHGNRAEGGGKDQGLSRLFNNTHILEFLCASASQCGHKRRLLSSVLVLELKRLLAGDPGLAAAPRWRLRLQLWTVTLGCSTVILPLVGWRTLL